MKKTDRNPIVSMAVGTGVMLGLAGGLIVSSGSIYKWMAGRNIPMSETPIYQAGVYEGTARGYAGDVVVTAQFSEYGIEDVTVNAQNETAEIGQAAGVALEKNFWKQQTCYVDGVAGATMTSDAAKKALQDCILQAAGEGNELAAMIEAERSGEIGENMSVEEMLALIPDGTYTYEDEEADDKGFRNTIELTVEDQKITNIIWDCVNADQAGKRELSENGQYVMTEDGPTWRAQADELANYVVLNQTTEGMLKEDGYASDAVASVSIYAGGYLNAVQACLAQAAEGANDPSVEEMLALISDGTYTYIDEEADDKGFRNTIEMTVEDQKITAITWDCINADQAGKRELSENGQYVMTEDGPTWRAQADELANYVVLNQTTDGMLKEDGYASDAVASVSIYAGGYLNAVQACLAQAAEGAKDPSVEEMLAVIPDGTYTYVDAEADDKGFRNTIEMTVESQKITAITWDCINDEQVGKRELSENGQYVMTEDGPTWRAQADELANYVVLNQTTEGMLREDGYASDAVASVSIHAGGYLNAVESCLREAAASVSGDVAVASK